MIIKMRRINFSLTAHVFHSPRPQLICWLALWALTGAGCTPDKTQSLLQPPQALGVVLAEEAATAAGANHQVAVIAPDASWGPTSIAESAFRTAMKSKGYSVVTAKSANLGDPMKFRAGLKGADFLEALAQSGGVGAVVSFAGAPLLSPAEAGQVSTGHPPVLVAATRVLGTVPGVASDRALLTRLLAAKIIQLAVIDGADSAAQKTGKSDATHEMFLQNYHVLRPTD